MAKNSKSARVPLLGGAYKSRSLIAGAQRAVNLFPENTPQINQPPTPVVHMLTPGLLPLIQPVVGMVRGAYRATNGALFICVGVNVYFVNTDFSYTLCGTINPGTSIVSFADNGTTMVVVDGSADGWWLGLGSTVLTQISDPAFYGANFTCYLDGYLIFNRPATNQFYISPPFWNGTDPFDPLDIAAKIGGPDVIIAVTVMHREIWLIGQLTTEVWYNAGGADFPFERQPGVFIEHGMVRGWSIAQADVNIFWLGRDRQGQSIVLMGKDYNAFRVSNHALEDAIQSYGDVTNCVGFTYQQDGHTFFVLTFPAADKTWAYDLTTGEWHERCWTDTNGIEHRIRPNCAAFAYNITVVGDWENGRIYVYDLDTYTDAGMPIVRRRGFPHLVNDGKRLSYKSFTADMEVATAPAPGPTNTVMLRWSDTAGRTWGNPVELPFGSTGDYIRSMSVRRLGMARDRVFELFWSLPYKTALQGAWIEVEPSDT